MRSPCAGRKFSKDVCTIPPRSSKCQWAEGPKRSFCRKISKKRFQQKQDDAARRIQRESQGYRSRQRRKSASNRKHSRKRSSAARQIQKAAKQIISQSPKARHFKRVARRRGQQSIRLFHERCRLFPHPVLIFSNTGIDVPINVNYAKALSETWTRIERIKDYLPPLQPHQHIYMQKNPVDLQQVFPKRKFSVNKKDVIIGIKYIREREEGSTGHVVFFEVRMHDTPSAIVVDPNGSNDIQRRWVLDIFFKDIPYEVTQSFNVNQKERGVAPVLDDLGFQDSFDLEGYCATIACYTFVDYICTNQWKAVDLQHHMRATREWIYAPEENKEGFFSIIGTQVRLNIISRYIAFHLLRYLTVHYEPPVMKRVSIAVKFSNKYDGLKLTFKVGTLKSVLVEETPIPIAEIETSFGAKKLNFTDDDIQILEDPIVD